MLLPTHGPIPKLRRGAPPVPSAAFTATLARSAGLPELCSAPSAPAAPGHAEFQPPVWDVLKMQGSSLRRGWEVSHGNLVLCTEGPLRQGIDEFI